MHICLTRNPNCSGLNPCDACHRARSTCLIQSLHSAGVTRDQMQSFIVTYQASWQAIIAPFVQAAYAQAAAQQAQPTLNGGDPHLMAPQASPHAVPVNEFLGHNLDKLTPMELRILRGRLGDNQEAIAIIEAALLRHEQMEERQAAEAAAREAEANPVDEAMEPMTPADYQRVFQEGLANNQLSPQKPKAPEAAAAAELATAEEKPEAEAVPSVPEKASTETTAEPGE